jgi:hypothetical protein
MRRSLDGISDFPCLLPSKDVVRRFERQKLRNTNLRLCFETAGLHRYLTFLHMGRCRIDFRLETRRHCYQIPRHEQHSDRHDRGLYLHEVQLPGYGWRLNRIRSGERILEPPPDTSDYGMEVTYLPISRADFIFDNLQHASNSERVITVDKASARLLHSILPILADWPFSTRLYNAMHDSRVNVLGDREFERNLHQRGLFLRAQSVRGSVNLNICFSNQNIPRDLDAEDFESAAGYWVEPRDDEVYSRAGSADGDPPSGYIRGSRAPEGAAEDPMIYGQWPLPRGRGDGMNEQASPESEAASSPEGFIEHAASGDALEDTPDTFIESPENEAELHWPYERLASPQETAGTFSELARPDNASEEGSEDEEYRAMLARPRRVHSILDDLEYDDEYPDSERDVDTS